MKTILTLSALCTLFASPAHAMLSPYWDTVKQFSAVLESDLSKHLGGKITAVKDLGNRQFELSSAGCKVRVSLEAHIPQMPGATSYSVKSVDSVRCN